MAGPGDIQRQRFAEQLLAQAHLQPDSARRGHLLMLARMTLSPEVERCAELVRANRPIPVGRRAEDGAVAA